MTTPEIPAGMIAIQGASAEVVGQVLSGKNLDRVLEAVMAKRKTLTGNERAAIHSISFDTLRHYGLLSAQLDALLTQPVSDAPVRNLLLVALSQLQFSKAAAHAIVDHAVTATEQMGVARAKPLINAVLRNFLRAPEKFQRDNFKTDIAKYDFPAWWIDLTKKEHPAHWESILLSARERPPMWLRVNVRRTTVEDYLQKLAANGMSAKHYSGHAVLLEKPVPVNELPGFREGFVSVQDEGAQQAAAILAPPKGARVLDACAAPGGKAGHLLESADIELLALDSDKRRLTRVADNLDRLGLSAKLVSGDASQPDAWWDGKPFDRILLDVPCSGSGVVRRHPDIKWIRRETDLYAFARQQTRLLGAVWNCLGNGGRLLYATCSIFRMENRDIVEQFIKKTPNARQLPLDLPLPTAAGPGDAMTAHSPDGQLLPDHVHDGFYYALLEKTG
ncbi:MAG: 16S rRNA (cytosine(967)-C(5))-methyltransferase RsmB [Betaproteobacteria bacterium]